MSAARAARRRSAKAAEATVIPYRRPAWYAKQAEFLLDPSRFVCVEASTKTGKTAGCLSRLFEEMLFRGGRGRSFWWVAPVYGQAEIAYRRLQNSTDPRWWKWNESKLRGTFLPNGSLFEFKSAERPDNLYGDDCFGAVFDEASRGREASWTALYSTLTATGGRAWLIGNVKGRKNFFYRLARRAQAGEPGWAYHKLTAWDAVAGGIVSRETIEQAQRDLAPDVFAELYLAEPSADGANPFGATVIRRVSTLPPPGMDGVVPGTGAPLVWGIDLGKIVDYTVATALDADGRVCRWHRFRMPWTETVNEIDRLLKASPGSFALVDSTGKGDGPVEDLTRRPHLAGRVEGFLFTGRSHQQVYEALALDLGAGALTLTKGGGGALFDELDNFTFTHTRTGIRYEAPEGFHDDCVASLALAAEARRVRSRRPSGLAFTLTL